MRYTSIFSPDKKVTAAQYISELVCKNRASNLKIELPIHFWDAPEWLKYYKAQLIVCYKFLKKYDADVLIKIIREKNIWSLFAKWINDEFLKEQQKRQVVSIDVVEHERIFNSTGIKNKKKNFGFLDE
jgi:hypothetical protein